jgi:alanyl-tRNA synthetase
LADTYREIFFNQRMKSPKTLVLGSFLIEQAFMRKLADRNMTTRQYPNIVVDGLTDIEVTNSRSITEVMYCTPVTSNMVNWLYMTESFEISSSDEVGFISSLDVFETYNEKLRRWPLRNNHTATHILNFCLREVLGDHIDQKGSLVAPHKLRFDFSHKSQIALPDLQRIEAMSVDWIKRNVKVYSKDLSLEIASRIPGLRAVFGESYPDPVRIVTLGLDIEEITKNIDNPKWRDTSVEFCGGT